MPDTYTLTFPRYFVSLDVLHDFKGACVLEEVADNVLRLQYISLPEERAYAQGLVLALSRWEAPNSILHNDVAIELPEMDPDCPHAQAGSTDLTIHLIKNNWPICAWQVWDGKDREKVARAWLDQGRWCTARAVAGNILLSAEIAYAEQADWDECFLWMGKFAPTRIKDFVRWCYEAVPGIPPPIINGENVCWSRPGIVVDVDVTSPSLMDWYAFRHPDRDELSYGENSLWGREGSRFLTYLKQTTES